MLMRSGIFTAGVSAQSGNRLFVLLPPPHDHHKSAIKGSCDLNNSRHNREPDTFMKMRPQEEGARRGVHRGARGGGERV